MACSFVYRELGERLKLDRRRLEAAHLRFAALQVMGEFKFKRIIYPDCHITLTELTPRFFDSFQKKFASELVLLKMFVNLNDFDNYVMICNQ